MKERSDSTASSTFRRLESGIQYMHENTRRRKNFEPNEFRVLHLPINTASLMSHNCEYLRAIGVDAVGKGLPYDAVNSIIRKGHIEYLPWDYLYERKMEALPELPQIIRGEGFQGYVSSLSEWTRAVFRRLKRMVALSPRFIKTQLAKILDWHRIRSVFHGFDILHWYSGYPIGDRVFRYMRSHPIPGVIAWQGSEIRIPELEFQTNPYYRYALDDDMTSPHGSYHQSKENQDLFCGEFGFIPVVTRGMSQYVLPEFREKMVEIFHPIILPDKAYYPDKSNTRPVVVHAPSHRKGKGTQFVEEALELLKDRVDFEYVELFGMEWAEAQQVMSRCDVFLDQFIVGDHGMASLEAMSYGKPVVCYIKESVKDNLPEDLPIINACLDNLASRLYWILSDAQKRHEIGIASRAYVEKYHDPYVTARHLEQIYRSVLGLHDPSPSEVAIRNR